MLAAGVPRNAGKIIHAEIRAYAFRTSMPNGRPNRGVEMRKFVA